MLAQAPGVAVIGDVESWIIRILYWGLLAIRVWAFVDCLIRKSAAFPAAGKLTKPGWALITALSAVIGYFLDPLNFLALISLIMFAFRPLPELAEYKTPLPGLFLTGASTHPGGGVFGASGLSAARVVGAALKKGRS